MGGEERWIREKKMAINSKITKAYEETEIVQQNEETGRKLQAKKETMEEKKEWFKSQQDERKSEKRELEPNPYQPVLIGFDSPSPAADPPAPCESITYSRKKQRSADCVNDTGLRFDANVPVKTIHRSVPELEGDSAGDYEVVREERTYRLAQRTSSYVVLEYVTPVTVSYSHPTLPTIYPL